ncbi:MAG: MaoC family dehydratase N-terminal domain-containing protein [Rhodospirillales bacterium]|nr:MaoC family dehydratase N-terminal domain-containing protein [Rhodospirillales bacterium]
MPAPEDAIGRSKSSSDRINAISARHLAATFDRDEQVMQDGNPLPPGWHWLYFLDAPPSAMIGADGRTVPGGFLPETGLPRRMWAGGSFTFERPITLGSNVSCEVTIADVARKEGRSGKLAFITTEHRISQGGATALVETRDLVFRAAPKPGETARRVDPPATALWHRETRPDAVLLFRFSALTFNAHRIHYDIDYCRDEEGYPGLVVHGPMLALLLLDLAECELGGRTFRRFRYRALAPLFVPDPFFVCGCPDGDDKALLWIESQDGAMTMSAELELA